MTRPVLVVGDVQGDSERLRDALASYPENEVETIFLGDFFQGGPPGGAGGMASARIARNRRQSRAVLGNHDVMLLLVLDEVRTGWTPPDVLARHGGRRFADVWLRRRGDWADLRALDDDPGMEAWLRGLPLMLHLDDGTLVQHCDDDRYAELGSTVDEVNATVRTWMGEEHGAWPVLWYTIGRHAFDDSGRLDRHLRHFGGTRVVHGHTPHGGDHPVARHGGRLWAFDGRFSRYWMPPGVDEGLGPVGATVALLPPLETA